MGKYQASDYRIAVITGNTTGRTGGDIIPDGMVGVIKHIAFSEFTNTGQNVLLRAQPSGTEFDGRRLAAQENYPDSWQFSDDSVHGIIGGNNVLQVVTSQATIVARVVYVIENGRV